MCSVQVSITSMLVMHLLKVYHTSVIFLIFLFKMFFELCKPQELT